MNFKSFRSKNSHKTFDVLREKKIKNGLMNEPLKFAIIGGGPIGLSSAISLREKGHHVHVFEAKTFPVDKVCGEGIMPSGYRTLQNLGIEKYLNPNFTRSFSKIKYFDQDLTLSGRLPRHAKAIRRTELNNALYELAKDKGVITHKNHRLVELNWKDGRYQPEFFLTERKKEKLDYDFDYIIACDGVHSTTRRILNLTESSRIKETRMGARVHVHFEHKIDEVQVYWNNGIEAYLTPSGENLLEIAFLWDESKITLDGNLEDSLFAFFPELQGYRDCPRMSELKKWGPFGKKSKMVSKENVIFLGDARYFLDGITGEGLTLGLKQAVALKRSFPGGIWSPTLFNLHVSPSLLHYKALTTTALFLSDRPETRNKIFKLTKAIPKAFDTILALNDLPGLIPDRKIYRMEDLQEKYNSTNYEGKQRKTG